MPDDYETCTARLSAEDARELEQLIAKGTVVPAFARFGRLFPDLPFADALQQWSATLYWKHGDPALSAGEVGRALASEFGVPFFFASTHDPDDRAPRWWDSAKALSLSRT